MNIALAVFVKTLGRSKIKTRIAKDIGEAKAARFYELATLASKSFIKNIKVQNTQIDFYWAIAELEGMKNLMWSEEKRIYQESGDLGARLNHVFQELSNENDMTIFMGSDSPHIDSNYLSEKINAFKASKHSFLIGPALDGGFYFFASKISMPKEAWLEVNYSTSTTLDELVKKLKNLGSINYLQTDFDIDDSDALEKLAEINPKGLTPFQKSLVNNLSELL